MQLEHEILYVSRAALLEILLHNFEIKHENILGEDI